MSLFRTGCLFAAALGSQTCHGQSDISTLEQAVKGKPLFLRSFSADPVAQYTWTVDGLREEPSTLKTLGLFTTETVGLKKNKIELQGFRSTLFTDSKNHKFWGSGKSPMRIVINLGSSGPASAISALTPLLFFPDMSSALAILPSQIGQFVPYDIADSPSPLSCNCIRFFDQDQWLKIPKDDPRLIRPKLIGHGTVRPIEVPPNGPADYTVILFRIPMSGIPEDLWIVRSAGPERDGSAELSAQEMRFTAAQFEGHPVEVETILKDEFKRP